MYYKIAIFFTIHCHTYWMYYHCYGSGNFADTHMLLKVECFEGFSNQINIDESVISSMSGCNHNNYKITSILIKINNKLA